MATYNHSSIIAGNCTRLCLSICLHLKKNEFCELKYHVIARDTAVSRKVVIRCLSDIERNSTWKCSYALSFLVSKHREPKSSNRKLFLPIIPIDIVVYAFSALLWDNLCRNNCIHILQLKRWIIQQCVFSIYILIALTNILAKAEKNEDLGAYLR